MNKALIYFFLTYVQTIWWVHTHDAKSPTKKHDWFLATRYIMVDGSEYAMDGVEDYIMFGTNTV